jgi:transcription-repair coupling factor (superfamily II helicase)
MDLTDISTLVADYAPYRAVTQAIAAGTKALQLGGLPVNAKAMLLAQLRRDLDRPLFVVTYSEEAASRLVAEIGAFESDPGAIAALASTAETLVYTEGAPDYELIGRRAKAVNAMLTGNPRFMIASVSSVLQRTVSPDVSRSRTLAIYKGASYDIADLQRQFASLGYERVEAVEMPGQWSRRGGIVDIFGVGEESGFRLDFFGDDLESIRLFDPETQRSTSDAESIRLLAARAMPLDSPVKDTAIDAVRAKLAPRMLELKQENLEERGEEHAGRLEERIESDLASLAGGVYFDQAELYLPYLFPDEYCLIDYIPNDAYIVVDEPSQAKSHWDQEMVEMAEIARARTARGEWLEDDIRAECGFDRLAGFLKARGCLALSLLVRSLDWLHFDERVDAVSAAPMDSFSGRLNALFDAIDTWLGNRMRCVIATRQPNRVREMLGEHKLSVAPISRLRPGGDAGVFVVDGSLPGGVKLPNAGLMLVSDPDMFGAAGAPKKRVTRFKEGLRIASYLELREGDYVVHIHHGIGLYRGLAKLKASDGAVRDYLLLEYAEGDRVYVPSDQVDRVQKYIGAGAEAPAVHRLNSGDWQRATKRARKQVQEMAGELIRLYAERHAADRAPYAPDSPWQHEMESAFPYEETPDQLKAIEEIKQDLEKRHPMDRLICGDVGYGKTEVAMRAAFKVVDGGRQVAVLCPTTILAQQHLNTFRDRFAPYPIAVEMVSRFVRPAEAARILQGLADGTIDIVIGTHKLLGKTVKFANLGLLIVDEEQRFGVTHKERIKQMRKSVDVVTLSATPIPRTLHMSMSGIRDLSLINDPPEGRRPIATYIREYDDELVREVILRELDRKGQVYFISNRVEGIYHVAERLRTMLPQARIAVAHGQMHEDDLEEVMLGFYHRDYDILVCTTIVESGLDVPNVNTIVVDNADRLGMAQLYQLRGRVGRSDRQGYAYLLTRKDKSLSEIAEKRLAALQEFSELGSGYKIALRDLEIRGAGNLLGREQSGTVSEIGFDLYTQLLSQAIQELKGEPTEAEFTLPLVNMPLDANIPTRYIPSEAERILMYKKLTAVRNRADVDDLQAELEDRYGDPPKAVWNLLALMRLRLRCKQIGVGSINTEKKRVIMRFAGTHLPQDSVKTLSRAFLQYEFATDHVGITLPETPSKALAAVEEMVEILVNALPDRAREERVGVAAAETTAAAPRKLREQLRGKGIPEVGRR